MKILFLSLIVGAGVTITVPFVLRLAQKFGALDQPGDRKIHKAAIPRLGGLAIFFGVMLGIILLNVLFPHDLSGRLIHILLLGVPVAFLIGFWDDLYALGSKRKFGAQVIVGLIVYYLGFRIELIFLGTGHTLSLGVFSLPFTMLWIAGLMNAINLIDGMDGLAAGVSAVAFTAIAFLAYLFDNNLVASVSLICASACIGFLIFNFHPAKIFMGDCGSMLLGFLLSILSMSIYPEKVGGLPIYVPLLILAFPILDTFVAIVRRIIQATDFQKLNFTREHLLSSVFKRILSADGDHIHHRLLSRGLSQRQAAMVLYGFSSLSAAVAFVMLVLPVPFNWICGLVTILGARQIVLSLDYLEFMPRPMRWKHQVLEWEGIVNRKPALARRVSGVSQERFPRTISIEDSTQSPKQAKAIHYLGRL